jgi:hypothetical protein
LNGSLAKASNISTTILAGADYFVLRADVDTIDGGLQDFMIQVLMQIISLSVAVGTIVYAVPFFIVPAVVIAYIHLWFARGYVSASRDLRRIESNTRSPIISSFSELVVGIVTGMLCLTRFSHPQL